MTTHPTIPTNAKQAGCPSSRIDVDSSPMPCDKWIAISALQKAIRRGHTHIAISAAATLLALDRSALWRRLSIVGFEDIGIGDIGAAMEAVRLGLQPSERVRLGGQYLAAVRVIETLTAAAKDRSADHLATAMYHHPSADGIAHRVGGLSQEDKAKLLRDEARPILERAVSAWYLCGAQRFRERRFAHSDFPALAAAYKELKIASPLIAVSLAATKRLAEPMMMLLPLLSSIEGTARGAVTQPAPDGFDAPRLVDGVPCYALGMHTRLGRSAVDRLIQTSPRLRLKLEQNVSDRHWRNAVGFAVWILEGALVDRRWDWAEADTIEVLGFESEFATLHMSPVHGRRLVSQVIDFLPALDDIRAELLEQHTAQARTQWVDLFGGLS